MKEKNQYKSVIFTTFDYMDGYGDRHTWTTKFGDWDTQKRYSAYIEEQSIIFFSAHTWEEDMITG